MPIVDGTSNSFMFGEYVHTDSKDHGIAWVSGDGGTRGGTSILEFAVENHPNNTGHKPGDELLALSHEAGTNDSIWIDIDAPLVRAFDSGHEYFLT
jgi:hypothetical protein